MKDPPAPTRDDSTLSGYLLVHDRPPAYEGSDGYPYTVSLEAEKTGDLRAPWIGYLVFPRWAHNGVGIVGHVESGDIARGATEDEAKEAVGAMTLHEVRTVLEEAIRRSASRDTTRPSSDRAVGRPGRGGGR